jgi:hypothetical protein
MWLTKACRRTAHRGQESARLSADAPKTRVKLTLSPQAEKYARRDAPIEARRMAARGALPLEAIDLATVLFALSHDPDADVKSTARDSLESLPPHVLDAVLTGPAHPMLLSYLARVHRENEDHCEKLALNPATDDPTIAFLATLPLRRVVEVVSNNQQRMLRFEGIVEALGANPLTGRAVIERILTFLGLDHEDEEEEPGEEELSEEAAEAAVLAFLGEDNRDIARMLASEEDVEDEELENNLFAAVQKMSVMQKLKLARIGGKEARSLLIKDRNKIVATSVLSSPKITENEIVAIANSRGVSDEILRIICMNRDWTKSYQIKLALVMNPKTPTPQAIKFINYLQDKELRNLMKSKDVSTQISTQARRILQKKGKI